MTADEAKKAGFTHHGAYYGIPCWIRFDGDVIVATKWAPLEWLFTLFSFFEALMYLWVFPNKEPGSLFIIGDPIDPPTVGSLFE